MTRVAITVDFWQPAFHGLDDRGRPEWPPSPFRLAQALMAGCHQPKLDSAARSALEALVALGNPIIDAPASWAARIPDTFTHRSGGAMEDETVKGGSLARVLDLTVAGLSTANRTSKHQGRTHLADCRLVYHVADPAGTVDVEALDRAAHRVPYFGRSQDGCDLTIAAIEGDMLDLALPDGDREMYVPELASESRTRGSSPTTRGWSPASCIWMDLHHETTTSGSQLRFSPEPYITRLRYVEARRSAPVDRASTLVVVPTRTAVPGPQIPALMQQIGPLPVTAFPCVVAGHQHADGRMRGIGLVANAGSTDPRLLFDVAADLRQHKAFLNAPDLGVQALDPRHWQARASHWRSATPLRAFPDDRVARELIARDADELTGQRPMELTLSRGPERPWQRPWSQPADGLGLWWVELHFAVPVQGPLILGRTSELGFGLMVAEGEGR